MPTSPKPWRRLAQRKGPNLTIFQSRIDTLEHPLSGRTFERIVLETPSWVNVVALTKEREILIVRQYRFGSGTVTDEIPGGAVDSGEDPEAAARRELREETGYTSTQWSSLGGTEPNPAFHDNLCFHYLAENVQKTHDLELDPAEDLVVLKWPLDTFREAILRGEIRHSLVISAASRILDLRSSPR